MRTGRLSALLALVLCWPAASRAEPSTPPTYHRDIAPILHVQCAPCHRPGESAPFALLSYDDARRRAGQIADITARRLMPPWKPVPGDLHFIGERRLSDAQIALLKAWHDAGAPQGTPNAESKPPAFTDGWQLGQPDLVVAMPEPYAVPAGGPDIYRSFHLPVEIPPGRFIRAAEYRPGNRRVVHHAVLSTMKREQIARRLAAEPKDAGAGFRSGLNAPGDRLPGAPGIWVPGKDALPLPDGYAMPWPAGTDLLVQLHLHPSGKPETEQSQVGLYFTDEPPKGALAPLVLLEKNVDIPPGAKGHTLKKQTTLKRDADVIGLFPHMHLIGRTCDLIATLPDGKRVTLLSIKDWDFRWQGYYQTQKPHRLPAGTVVECTWTFDNTAENPAQPSQPPKRVRFGEQTTDEMGAIVLDVIWR